MSLPPADDFESTLNPPVSRTPDSETRRAPVPGPEETSMAAARVEPAAPVEEPPSSVPTVADTELKPEELAEAQHYARLQRKYMLMDRAVDLVYWGVAGFLLARPLEKALASVGVLASSDTLRLAGLFLLLIALHALVSVPLSFYSGYVLEHRFGLSRLSVLRWVWRYAKGLFLASLLTIFLVAGLFWIIRLSGPWWWVVGALAFFGVSVVLGQMAPVLILPLFYRVERLDRPDLAARLRGLAEETGLTIEGVYRLDLSTETVKANAALAGLGRTRRVLLGDTLLVHLSPEEIETIFAHELGHHVYRHIPKMLGIGLVSSAVGFWICDRILTYWVTALQGSSDAGAFVYETFPVWAVALLLFLLGVLGILTEPLLHALSRRHEREADRYALERTSNPDAFMRAFRRLARLNKEDPNPPTWEVLLFHSHPPIRQRLALAEDWKTRLVPKSPP